MERIDGPEDLRQRFRIPPGRLICRPFTEKAAPHIRRRPRSSPGAEAGADARPLHGSSLRPRQAGALDDREPVARPRPLRAGRILRMTPQRFRDIDRRAHRREPVRHSRRTENPRGRVHRARADHGGHARASAAAARQSELRQKALRHRRSRQGRDLPRVPARPPLPHGGQAPADTGAPPRVRRGDQCHHPSHLRPVLLLHDGQDTTRRQTISGASCGR